MEEDFGRALSAQMDVKMGSETINSLISECYIVGNVGLLFYLQRMANILSK